MRNWLDLKINFALRGLAAVPHRRHWLVLVPTSVFLAFAIYGLSQLRLQLDIYDVYDPSLRSSQAQWQMRQEFGDTNSIFVTLTSSQGISLGSACGIKNFLNQYSNWSQDVEKVIAPWAIRVAQKEGADKLWYPTVLPDPCLGDQQKLTRNHWNKFSKTPWEFFFQGKNDNQISFEIAFRERETSSGERKFDVASIAEFQKELEEFIDSNMPEIETHIFGQVSIRWYILEAMKKDSVWNVGILVFFLLFFYFFLGTWRAGLYYGLTLLFTEILLFGVMGLLGFPIDIMSNCLFLMTAVAGVSDFLFISSAQKEGAGWKKSFIEVATPSFFTSVTTFVGFVALGLSEIPIVARFGYAAAIGAMLQWSSTYLVVPALMQLFGAQQGWVKSHAHRQLTASWFVRMNQFVPNRWITVSMVMMGAISIFGVTRLNVGEDILNNFPAGHPLPTAYHWLEKDKGWQGQIFLLFRPNVKDSEIQKVLDGISKISHVAHVESPLLLEDFMTRGLTNTERDLVLRDMTRPLLKRYRSGNGFTRVPIYNTTMDVKKLGVLTKELERVCRSSCFLAGQTVVYLEYSERVSRSLIDSLSGSLIAVTLLLIALAWLRKSRSYFSLIVSSIWGPLVMMGFLWGTQVPISSVTSIFFALIVGWTGDNAIQYLYAEGNVLDGAEQRSSATLMQTLVFVGCSFFLTMQTLVPMQILGLLFILGFFVTYIGDLWLLKGLLLFRKQISKPGPGTWP